MTRLGWAALALCLGAAALSPVRGASCGARGADQREICGLCQPIVPDAGRGACPEAPARALRGEGVCHVDDGLALLQASADLQVDSQPAAGAASTLCALAPAGGLAPEVAAFLKENANNTQLEGLLSKEWNKVCAGPGATDAGLVSRLRAVVHAFAGRGRWSAPSPVEMRSDEAVQKSAREELGCVELKSQLESWGLNTTSRVMDYGCGGGGSLAAYGKCGIGQNNVGIDVQDVRAEKNKEFFQFVQLEEPYSLSLENKISSEHLDGAFGLVFSEEVFHHIGSESDVRLTSKNLGRALAPCGVFVLEDWDNPGHPDMTPLYDLTHTFWTLLCLPYTKEKAEKCVGNISDQQLHEMWEGEHTIYLSLERYRKVIETEAGVKLVHQKRYQGGGWNEILHPFQLVFRKPC